MPRTPKHASVRPKIAIFMRLFRFAKFLSTQLAAKLAQPLLRWPTWMTLPLTVGRRLASSKQRGTFWVRGLLFSTTGNWDTADLYNDDL